MTYADPLTQALNRICTRTNDPVLDAERYYGALEAMQARRDASVQELARLFLQAAQGDVSKPAEFAGYTTDWSVDVLPGESRPMRRQTVAEVMFDSLDYSRGPKFEELASLLCLAAAGMPVQESAKKLLDRMADTWADMNVEEE